MFKENKQIYRASLLRGYLIHTGLYALLILVVFLSFQKWRGEEIFAILFLFSIPLVHFLLHGRKYDVILTDDTITGRNGRGIMMSRVKINRHDIDIDRSSRTTMLDRLLGQNPIWSKSGEKIALDVTVYNRYQRRDILRNLGVLN